MRESADNTAQGVVRDGPNGDDETTRTAAGAPPCDGCDTKLINVNTAGWSDRQRRFLVAYRHRPSVAPAARLAGVHRATVYRWLTDAAFADAMRAAADVFFRAHRAKVLAAEADRQRWRQERERARRPMRCHYLALARAAKRRYPGGSVVAGATCHRSKVDKVDGPVGPTEADEVRTPIPHPPQCIMDFDWKQRAKEVIAAGYVPGGEWENLLRNSMKRARRKLVKELGDEFEAYLQVQTARALDQYRMMTEQGTPPDIARELALSELLGTGD